MKATEVLSAEHRVIEQVLNCLDALVQRAEAGEPLDKGSAQEAIAFFRGFADTCHHRKEENHLFPAMAARGFSGDCGPIAVMLREHELGRLYVRGMDAALDKAASGDAQALQWFVADAQSYSRLLREHIQKEDRCLFPSTDRAMSESDQAQLAAAFEKVEAEEVGEGTHAKYHHLADELARRFHVPRAESHTAGETGHACGR